MKRVDTALQIMTAWLADLRLLSLSAYWRMRLCILLTTKVVLNLFYRQLDVYIRTRLLRQSLLAQQRVVNRIWYRLKFAVFTGSPAVRPLGGWLTKLPEPAPRIGNPSTVSLRGKPVMHTKQQD